jgi:transposase InsO family protein
MDLFVVPTIGFDLLYVLIIVRLARRELVWINVTSYPTAEWIARQVTEAFPWDEAPRYLIRDQDGIYGAAVTRRLRAMGIRDKPIAPGSPWQNGFAERPSPQNPSINRLTSPPDSLTSKCGRSRHTIPTQFATAPSRYAKIHNQHS